MRIHVHDFSGHPFQAQLSRALAVRGHDVLHSSCPAYVSGKGDLEAQPGETVRFATVGEGRHISKMSYFRRLFEETSLGFEIVGLFRREKKPDVVLISNMPVPMQVVLVAYLFLRRIPWVFWHQDVVAVALAKFATKQRSPLFSLAAKVMGAGERWAARRAAAIVVIAESFLPVHEEWGTLDRAAVVHNWAPIEEIYPTPRHNDWAAEHGLLDQPTLVYSGTLGLKHNPELLAQLTARVRSYGIPARLVVVNEGPAVEAVRASAAAYDVPLTLLPYQPYDRLPEVLGSADLLLVVLEKEAGEFSVPSKTLTSLAAGRPILGLMPGENAAAGLLDRAGCGVFEPTADAIDAAAAWAAGLLADPVRHAALVASTRELAEEEFDLVRCVDKFERLLREAAHGRVAGAAAILERDLPGSAPLVAVVEDDLLSA